MYWFSGHHLPNEGQCYDDYFPLEKDLGKSSLLVSVLSEEKGLVKHVCDEYTWMGVKYCFQPYTAYNITLQLKGVIICKPF